MKKILISVLLVSLAFAAFADDAKVLPEGVLRATLANLFITADSGFDVDGEKQSISKMTMDNFGAALEFGVTDSISAAFQWAPGTFLYSKIEGQDKVEMSGIADLFVGAKVQFLNDDNMRFAFAPGLVVPLDFYDAVKEGENYVSGEKYRPSSASETESLGIGLRVYFDYKVTKDFYINLYNQTRYYIPNSKYDQTSLGTYVGTYSAAVGGVGDAAAKVLAADATEKYKYEYPVYLDFELEPHYDLTLSKTGSMGFGLPVDFSMNGKTKIEGTEQNDDSYSLSINPGLSFFYSGGFPFEVAANYSVPLMGKNVQAATSVFTFKVKLFYDFY